jgi:secreted trypsin-like serine protease
MSEVDLQCMCTNYLNPVIRSYVQCDRISSTVRIGVYDRRSIGDADRVFITEEVVHPEYSSSSFGFDAMIMKLRRKSERPYIRILNDGAANLEDEELTVIGFGDTLIGNSVLLPNVMQETQLDYVDNDACKEMHGNFIIQDDMLCAYRDNTDSWCVVSDVWSGFREETPP